MEIFPDYSREDRGIHYKLPLKSIQRTILQKNLKKYFYKVLNIFLTKTKTEQVKSLVKHISIHFIINANKLPIKYIEKSKKIWKKTRYDNVNAGCLLMYFVWKGRAE